MKIFFKGLACLDLFNTGTGYLISVPVGRVEIL
jgi:hypothetical protein